MFRECCISIDKDEDFCVIEEKAVEYREMLRKILLACSDGERRDVKQFVLWLYGSLWSTVVDARAAGGMVDREKLWRLFYQLRTTDDFSAQWGKFLQVCKVAPKQPELFQHISLMYFKAVIAKAMPLPADAATANATPSSLTFEEVNAIKYMGGYIIRALRSEDQDLEFLVKDRPAKGDAASTSECWVRNRQGRAHSHN